jgi:hypothetical protein
MRLQVFELRTSQLEQEIVRKSPSIPANLLIEAPRCYTIQLGQGCIEDDAMTAHDEYSARNAHGRVDGRGRHFRRMARWSFARPGRKLRENDRFGYDRRACVDEQRPMPRYPSAARSALLPIVVDFIDTRPAEIVGSFVVIEPSSRSRSWVYAKKRLSCSPRARFMCAFDFF